MKRLIVLSVALVMGFATLANAEIAGSNHDFSGQGFAKGQICLPCHAPHNASQAVTNVPLWNHAVSIQTYQLYTSDTIDAGSPSGSLAQPSGVSKLCLSCHDGTIAIDAFGGNPGSQMITGNANIGADLSNDHPISFTYDTALALADGSLNDPSTALAGLAGSNGTIADDMLFGNSLECASCHDVHNKFGNESLLIKSNAGSLLCLTCHDQ